MLNQTYMPDFINYEIQAREISTGKWYCLANEQDLLFALAYAMRQKKKLVDVPVRILKKDLRESDPKRIDHSYLKPSVVWVSQPSFPSHKDYWFP